MNSIKFSSINNVLARSSTICHKSMLFRRSIATLPRAIIEVTHPDYQVYPSALDSIERIKKYTVTHHNNQPSILFEYGKGSYLYDTNDREYLDFTAGITAVNALGHADPQIAQDLYDQSQKLVHTSHLYHSTNIGLLAEKLVETTRLHGESDWASKVFFLSNSGSEAINEGALKFARKWGKSVGGENKSNLISFKSVFHNNNNRSMVDALLSATKNDDYHQESFFAPLNSGAVTTTTTVLPFNNIYKMLHEVNENTAGVIIEPIQGESGVHVADPEFMLALRERCNQTNTLLIYDETKCGLGKSGKMWAHQHFDKVCTPDMLTMATPLANGVPIGTIMTTEKVAEVVSVDGHGATFGRNPLAAAVALGVIDRITNDAFLKKVVETSHALKRDLKALQDEYPEIIKEVRGEGLLIGVEFSKSPEAIVKLSKERGLLIATASYSNTILLSPPLTLSKAEAREGISRLSGAIDYFANKK